MDRETGMYYYGARYYDPRISIFVSVDPLAEQTMEPYLYTGNNPIMFTDPTGMSKEGGEHDYRLNKDGSMTTIRETKDTYDRIFAEGDEEQPPLYVDKSFTNSLKNPKYEGSYEGKISSRMLKTYGKAIFRFFANNTDREWSYSEFTNENTGERFANIVTSYNKGTVQGISYYIKDILGGDSNINWDYNVHSHPNTASSKNFYPSGWTYNKLGNLAKSIRKSDGKPNGDRGFYQSFKQDSKYNTRMPEYLEVYSPKLNKSILYNDETFFPNN